MRHLYASMPARELAPGAQLQLPDCDALAPQIKSVERTESGTIRLRIRDFFGSEQSRELSADALVSVYFRTVP
jgi:hypothetical protein